ncbi:MAG: hypothetical protein IT210_12420 [Armatimonadetes bacterium]|nr:hypothetical protein [Armatimonadota bacterium]
MTPDIIGLGMATLDVLIRLEEMPTWERGGSFLDFGLDGGGPAGTACVAAARLGATVGFIGTCGNDEAAGIKMRSFAESGVDTSRTVRRDRPENQAIIVHVQAGTGERVFSGKRGFGEALLEPEELDRDYIASARYLHLDGFHFEAAVRAARWVREAGGKISLDCARTDGGPVSQEWRSLLEYVDILICGSGFGRSLTGHRDFDKAGEDMLAIGPEIVVQTEGADGSYTTTEAGSFHTPAFPVEVVDTTGAGDVFHGAYLVGLLRGWDVAAAARFATAVSAIKCTRLGGRRGIPTFDEVISFLQDRSA